ncbi:pyruvate formate-lyase-activating protein [Oscillospiraceae bacterium MB08-C2-2]|nr:pyruvate formate-lyase-activating protein [Oscillospiraceae bacterium MB08-C2-2]
MPPDIDSPIYGRIHSYETLGTVDGPGLRFVLFLQGCSLRCLYCHNPDTWSSVGGRRISSAEMESIILEYKGFIRTGGVTLSGGEPLLQPAFCADLIRRLKKHGIHTALDTSGALPVKSCLEALELADMLLLDIKALDEGLATELTGVGTARALETLDWCEQVGKPVWIRHVLLPGYTLDTELLEDMAAFLSTYTCIERVDLLPFHKMGEYKWETLGLLYKLTDTPTPEREQVEAAKGIFRRHGLYIPV